MEVYLLNYELLTVEEVANILRLNVRTIWRMLKDGRLKGIRLGGGWRIPKEELEKILVISSPEQL
jgi:excisionase family DNA binding protein